MLRKPGSQYQKVCLYRDGCNMFVYGDYGQFTFDSMTWTGSVYNLEYDNIGYQMEKLNRDSRNAIEIYDEDKCREDIIKWLKQKLYDIYDYSEKDINTIITWIKDNGNDIDDFYIENFVDDNMFYDIQPLLEFTSELFDNVEEPDWIAFLRNTDRLDDFDEVCESSLWNAGKCIHQRYFICMYALQVCGEKLKDQKEKI